MCCALAQASRTQSDSAEAQGDRSFATYYNRFRNDNTVRELTFVRRDHADIHMVLLYVGPISYFFRNYVEFFKLFVMIYDVHTWNTGDVTCVRVRAQMANATTGNRVLYPNDGGAPLLRTPENTMLVDLATGSFWFDDMGTQVNIPNDNLVMPSSDDPPHYTGRVVVNVLREHYNRIAQEISTLLLPFRQHRQLLLEARVHFLRDTELPEQRGAGDGLTEFNRGNPLI